MDMVDKDLDVRDIWCGIRMLKSAYSPSPYCRRDSTGHIGPSAVAERAADHLEKKQWANDIIFSRDTMPM
eukprot:11351431-Prorocentrum_lima.AAC.1